MKIVTVFQDKPGWELIAQPDIKSVAQLRGKNIAIMSPEGSLAVVAREILRKNGLDPGKDVNLVVMGGDEVRFPALQTKAIQATLFNTAMSIRAQREGFTKLAVASDYANLIEGGLATSTDRLKQNPDKIFHLIRAALKGIHFFVSKKEPAVKYMMEALRMKDRELTNTIYDLQSRLVLRDGYADDKVLQLMIDEMKKTTKIHTRHQSPGCFRAQLCQKSQRRIKVERLETLAGHAC